LAVLLTACQLALSASESVLVYRVQSGDSLAALAKRFGVEESALRAKNGMVASAECKPGDTLIVWSSGSKGKKAGSPGDAANSPSGAEALIAEGGEVAGRIRLSRNHQVQAGETLATIASRYGVSVDQILRANEVHPANDLTRLAAGQTLVIPIPFAEHVVGTQVPRRLPSRSPPRPTEVLDAVGELYPPESVDAVGGGRVVIGLRAPPFERRGTMMVPVRDIFEWLGASVEYSGGEIKAAFPGKDREVRLQVGRRVAFVGEGRFDLDEAPLVRNGLTYVPLRFVSESGGAVVDYCKASSTITIGLGEKQGFIALEWRPSETATRTGIGLGRQPSDRAPLRFVSARVSFNVIGNPEAWLAVRNQSVKTVDAYEVSIYCYNRFSEPVRHYAYGSNRFKGISQGVLMPGEGSEDCWTLYGHENTTSFKAVVDRIHMTDGTVWRPKKGHRVEIRGKD
jgi:LysM repeat protein